LTACVFNTSKISFNPIPYEMKVPKELASKLSLEPMTGDWANQIAGAGVVGALTMYLRLKITLNIILLEFITPQKKDLMLQLISVNLQCLAKKFHVKTNLC
jgi:hypothetical protein